MAKGEPNNSLIAAGIVIVALIIVAFILGRTGVVPPSIITSTIIASTTIATQPAQSTSVVSTSVLTTILQNNIVIPEFIEQIFTDATGVPHLIGTGVRKGANYTSGGTISYSLTFPSGGGINGLPYVINYILSNTSGFNIVNITPALPYIENSASGITVNAVIQSPDTAYNGNVEIRVGETFLSSGSTFSPLWNERIGLLLARNTSNMTYNVTAVAQKDPTDCGPVYFLNGVSNLGQFYQLGLAYNLCNATGSIYPGFTVEYSDYASGGDKILRFNGQVSPNDLVQLSMHFVANGTVVLSARDLNSGITVNTTTLYALGAKRFVGAQNQSPPNSAFTGLMTEWQHVNVYYGPVQKTEYVPTCFGSCIAPTEAVWIDEYYITPANTTFSGILQTPTSLSQSTILTWHGAVANYSTNGTFITGS